jgi:dipeptidyl aminopeptidase/acylaminoacyl peptidase
LRYQADFQPAILDDKLSTPEKHMNNPLRNIFFSLALLVIASPSFADLPALIPREVLFGNPVKEYAQISPNGIKMSYLAPSKEGVLSVWVKTIGKEDDQILTNNSRPIYAYKWAYDDKHLLYFQDSDGDENDHVFSIDIENKVVRDMTPFLGKKAVNLLLEENYPNEFLVGLNVRDPKVFDMYRINIESGSAALDTQNPGDVLGWTTDANFVIRAATAFNPDDLSTAIRIRDAADKPWRDLIVFPFTKSHMLGQVNGGNMVIGFPRDGKSLFITSTLNSDTLRLERVDAATGKTLEVLAEDPRSDIWTPGIDAPIVLFNDHTKEVEGAMTCYTKPEYKFANAKFKQDIENLQKLHSGVPFIENTDRDYSKWIVSYIVDDGPAPYYAYDRATGKAQFLFFDIPNLEKYKLAKMEPVIIPSRDGLQLVSYLTLPVGVEPKGLPLVMVPHGGPWYRDSWGFDKDAQWLANRGYAVLQVEFRGSVGFGNKFVNAGTGEWGRKMQNDISDGVRWAIDKGIADPKRVAIYGGSYGGYATLAGITFTPELYACAVDLVGPSDVKFLLNSIPSYWKPVKRRWETRIGPPATDDAENRRISPVYHVDQIRVPLLIAHGANDPRVNLASSETIVKEMREKKLDVTFLVYPDEGHGFARPENNLDFYGRAEEFFQKCLNGRAEPWVEIKGSTVEIR